MEMDSIPTKHNSAEDRPLVISNTSSSLSKSDFGSLASLSDIPEFSATYSGNEQVLIESSTTLQVNNHTSDLF